MYSIIHQQVSDMASNAKLKPDDFLLGIQSVQKQVYDEQAAGRLTKDDADDTLKWIDSYTRQKISAATNTAGMEMHNASKMFSDLPPEYRDVAIRNLFYATRDENGHDQKLTQQQYQARAAVIKDQINVQRRQAAQSTLKAVTMSDDEILKTSGYTMNDVEQTSKETGASPQDVIKQLRIKRVNAERMSGRTVKSIKGAPEPADESDSAPAQASAPEEEDNLANEMNQ